MQRLGWPFIVIVCLLACAGRSARADEAAPRAAAGHGWRRHRPLGGDVELGLLAGYVRPAPEAGLGLSSAAPRLDDGLELGARLATFGPAWLGLELDGATAPLRTQSGARAHLGNLSGSVVLQAPQARVVPFFAGGAGATLVRAEGTSRGVSVGPLFALGARFLLDERVGVRFDVRDRLLPSRSGGRLVHTLEMTLGVFARYAPRAEPAREPSSAVACGADPFVAPALEAQPDAAGDARALPVGPSGAGASEPSGAAGIAPPADHEQALDPATAPPDPPVDGAAAPELIERASTPGDPTPPETDPSPPPSALEAPPQ